MIRDLYSSQDLLFSIHPTDGSILIWLVDWLDEFMPTAYRQPQVSFHAKLPNTIPVGDAMSLSHSVFLFTQPVKNSFEICENKSKGSKQSKEYIFSSGVVNMVSKHNNGTLNLWRLQFQENSKYQSLVNTTHLSRICGHRLRLSDISSHPILPFLLTNSLSDKTCAEPTEDKIWENNLIDCFTNERPEKVQKGLIIWGVEPVGPLSVSGGIYELARVDSVKENAFENIAWFPCFLPSFTLGNSSGSPSTFFVSSDSSCITIYQAVFDARTLLHEIKSQMDKANEAKSKPTEKRLPNALSSSSSTFSNITDIPFDSFNVISIQSTARPGCVIELEKIVDSNENWTKADLFHVYQEDLVRNANKIIKNTLNPTHQFNETYFLVFLEKKRRIDSLFVEIVHMWKINVTSVPMFFTEDGSDLKSNLNQRRSNTSNSEESAPGNKFFNFYFL